MIDSFKNGTSIEELEIKYGLKKVTIKKHLKSFIGDEFFEKLLNSNHNNKTKNNLQIKEIDKSLDFIEKSEDHLLSVEKDLIQGDQSIENSSYSDESFFEIPPLKENIDFDDRKELTSKPLKEFSLPDNTFMIVDKNIELNILFISDFPEYRFLPEVDQKRMVIKLFSNKKIANSFCSKNQKVIKIPNGNVFNLASPFLINKGISRIIFDDYLLSI